MNLLTLKDLSSPATPLSTLTKWARNGKLTGSFKLGKKWVIQEEDWIAFIEKEREAYNTPLSAQTPINKLGGQDEL